jgi:hypothetical protein
MPEEEAMTIHKLAISLTLVNVVLLALVLAQARATATQADAPVLRGRSLEIVDDRGRVRASIKIHPASSTAGVAYPETVMLRLIDANGRPEVKLGASEQGAGLGLVGAFDTAHALLSAEGASSSLKLTSQDGRQQLLKP